jgi:hypothetical protein
MMKLEGTLKVVESLVGTDSGVANQAETGTCQSLKRGACNDSWRPPVAKAQCGRRSCKKTMTLEATTPKQGAVDRPGDY